MSRGRADDLDPSCCFEGSEGSDQVAIDIVEQLPQPDQPVPPEPHQWKEVGFTGGSEGGRRLIAGLDPLIEEGLHLGDEGRVGQLVGEDRRKADGDRRRDGIGCQAAKHLEQRQVGIERGFTEPVAAVRPTAVVQHIGQVAVQGEDEVHRAGAHRAAPDRATARR